ncbi:NACHT domain-containing protein [Fischerella sp. JS2]|uniref:NACHT domain-containing protein n=1 Tax=Fischerella sp. JS2 TaxID=2597771 RepID=UPI0028F05F61|nr:hypothetical protein [Fischerella sp. JS2]
MADFDEKQIAIFAQNWFQLTDPVKGERFIQKLKENESIQELASSPLLLTLLCLVFGDSGDFPANRSELYKEGLNVLLKKWDAKRNIEREQVYKNLSLQRKEDLLSQIALTTFEQKDYFFKQKTTEVYIADFIRNLRDADTDPKVLKLDSEAVLKFIEAQHGLLVERAKGIYSFSHLTFHEYFAAREIVANSALESLVEHITEISWREVFLLAAGMMRKADDLLLLMKSKIDSIVALDDKLQYLLQTVYNKSLSVKYNHKGAVVRAFYLEHALFFSYSVLDYCSELTKALGFNIEVDPEIDFDEKLTDALEIVNSDPAECLSYALSLNLNLEPEFQKSLQNLKKQIPYPDDPKKWMQREDKTIKQWLHDLRSLIIRYRKICYQDELNDQQCELIWNYYDANTLMVDCLNSDCYISRQVRQEIEDSLLLPISEGQK